MPKITLISVQTKNKDRCNLFVDGNFFAGISLITLVKSRLKVDDEVDEKELKNLLLESERTQAFTKAVDYLSRAMKTKRQVKEYLLNKGYDEQIVWYCIDKLKDYGYIDDSEYSKRYISSCSKNQGKRLVEYKLMAKGVKKEDIENAYADVDVDSKSNAKAVAEKYLKNKETTKENMAKAYRYLIGRGFSYEDATFALSFFNGED